MVSSESRLTMRGELVARKKESKGIGGVTIKYTKENIREIHGLLKNEVISAEECRSLFTAIYEVDAKPVTNRKVARMKSEVRSVK